MASDTSIILARWIDAGYIDDVRLSRYGLSSSEPHWLAVAEYGPDDEAEGDGDTYEDALATLVDNIIRQCAECHVRLPRSRPDLTGDGVRYVCSRCEALAAEGLVPR